MTVLESIQANPVFVSFPEAHIQKLLDSRSIDGAANYSSSSLKNVELVSADIYADMALLPEFREGQLALKYDKKELLKRAKFIYDKHDDPKASSIGPTVIPIGVTITDL